MLPVLRLSVFLGTQRGLINPRPSDVKRASIETVEDSSTESLYLLSMSNETDRYQAVGSPNHLEVGSKAGHCALINLSPDLPLPSTFYQNNYRRIHYDDQLWKHTRFNNEYIYAFTWEDPRDDHRVLKICNDDVVVCVTSAGDNVLDYIYNANPRRVHAIDLNPNQNHLLELKIAALQTLPYAQVWKMFGEGRLKNFREVLINQLSPHMSSQACQYWIRHAQIFASSNGLYETGGSRHVDHFLCVYC